MSSKTQTIKARTKIQTKIIAAYYSIFSYVVATHDLLFNKLL